MSDFAAPVRENASGLSDASPVPVLAAQAAPVPASPAVILAAQQPAKAKSPRRFWLYGVAGVVVGQLVLPQEVKPVSVAGNVASAFYMPYLQQSANIGIEVARKQALAQRLAEMKGEYSDSIGKCTLALFLGPDAARLCKSAVDMRYLPAIQEAEAALGRR